MVRRTTDRGRRREGDAPQRKPRDALREDPPERVEAALHVDAFRAHGREERPLQRLPAGEERLAALDSKPSSHRYVGLTAMTALKRSGRLRNAWTAKRPPNEWRETRTARPVRPSTHGSALFEEVEEAVGRALVGKRRCWPKGPMKSARVGVRSRDRSVFVTPTTIACGIRPFRARKSTVAFVCRNCVLRRQVDDGESLLVRS